VTLDEIKDLITFGKQLGLQSLSANGVDVVYGFAGEAETPKPQPQTPVESTGKSKTGLPPELAHFSAVGRAAMGKAARDSA
jgi:hypothetical protein